LTGLFQGRSVEVTFRSSLSAWRGRLLTGQSKGRPVHAATFLRQRRIVLDCALLEDPVELSRILAHELFHFAWIRLGNPCRRSWEALLLAEFQARARGELGWSAEHRKRILTSSDQRHRTIRWREYICESFCDSAACFQAGVRSHAEFTLAPRFLRIRRIWFQQLLAGGKISI